MLFLKALPSVQQLLLFSASLVLSLLGAARPHIQQEKGFSLHM